MNARILMTISLLLAGCGPHYSIPDMESDNVGTVVSSGRTASSCIENLQEDAKDLRVRVKLTEVKHEPSTGPISWIYTNSYICTGKVVKAR